MDSLPVDILAVFDIDNFEGIRCFKSTNPDDWHLVYSSVEGYRDAWIKMSGSSWLPVDVARME